MENIIVISMSSFVFALPVLEDKDTIEVTVNYTRDSENRINSEAWLHPVKRKAMMFIADVCSFADNGQTEDEIENWLIDYYGSSDIFANSVNALLSEQYDYFLVDE